MDNREYLRQISSEARPSAAPKPAKFSFLSSPIFKIALGGIAAFILIAIIGGVLSGSVTSLKDQTIALKLYLDTTMSAISTYQPSIKSSDLRSSSASLYSILSATNSSLTTYVTEKYDYREKTVSEKITTEENLHRDSLDTDLFEAKINGILDRIYAHKMAYEISLITTKESHIINSDKDSNLKNFLTSSYNSLNNLYDNFADFSETRSH